MPESTRQTMDVYQRQRNQYAPDDLRLAVQEMARDGHGDYAIADTLRLDVQGVRKLIGERR